MLFNIWLNKALIILLLCLFKWLYITHVGYLWRPDRRSGQIPWICSKMQWRATWHVCWELNSGPWKEQCLRSGSEHLSSARLCKVVSEQEETNKPRLQSHWTDKYTKKLVPSEEHTITNTGTVTCLLLMYATTEYLFIRQTNPNLIKS